LKVADILQLLADGHIDRNWEIEPKVRDERETIRAVFLPTTTSTWDFNPRTKSITINCRQKPLERG